MPKQPSPMPDKVVIPAVEESLSVSTEGRETGRVSIRTVPVTERVLVEDVEVGERLRVERVRFNRPVVSREEPREEEGGILVIPVYEERLVTTSELLLVEELRVIRERHERRVPKEMTLTRERIEVERQSAGNPSNEREHTMTHRVIGYFERFEDADAAVKDLETAGFERNEISIVTKERGEHKETPRMYGAGESEEEPVGVGKGAVIGGVTGLLVGLGALMIPGIGPVMASGPLVAAVGTGAGALSGAVAAPILDTLLGAGIPEHEAHSYIEGLKRGGVLVSVEADESDVDEVVDILERHGAVDINEKAREWTMVGGMEREAEAQSTRIPVVEEELTVGKAQVNRGGVQVYSRVREVPVESEVSLRDERVTVERIPTDRPATDEDLSKVQEGEISFTERDEEAVVGKQARVVEEIEVGKEATERKEVIRDKVRRTEVDVKQIPPKSPGDEGRTGRGA